ncbi:MAG: hypothetical protein IT495_13725 [Gammaproteobacteria bacterium]|nr:hypothetical protein [Gammaproteobacteria bacterium]
MSSATGLSRPTVRAGRLEIESAVAPDARSRRAGAGRPRLDASQPGLQAALEALVDAQQIRVSHFPPGTIKWNTIEHRLFCHITRNWRGKALCTFESIVDWIGNTRTEAGLRVKAWLDKRAYPTGAVASTKEMNALSLHRDEFQGDWNDSLHPRMPDGKTFKPSRKSKSNIDQIPDRAREAGETGSISRRDRPCIAKDGFTTDACRESLLYQRSRRPCRAPQKELG